MIARRRAPPFARLLQRTAVVACLALGAAGCPGQTDDDAADDDTGDDDDTTAVDPHDRTLAITVAEARMIGVGDPYAYASVQNPVYPDLRTELLAAGDCVFVEPLPPDHCDPPCSPPDSCTPDGSCEPPPARFGAGTIDVDGLRSALQLTPSGEYHYYAAAFDPEPVDGELFDAGAPITASAAGDPDGVGPFTVATEGADELQTSLTCPPALVDGEPLVVTWTPGEPAAPVQLTLQSGNHALQFTALICDADDTGELVVDAALVSAYLADWHPVETWSLQRTAMGATTVDGTRVELSSVSRVDCTYSR